LKYVDGPMSGPNPGGVIDEWSDYLKLFKQVRTQKAIGEASVCYLWSPSAPANIHARIPQAKIIVILRDPVERAFSQYLQYAASGIVKRTFRQHIDLCTRSNAHSFGAVRPFLEYGLYYGQVKRYLEFFPRKQVRIFLYEEAWRSPSQLVKDTFEFLGVDPCFSIDTSKKSLQRQAPRSMTMHYLLRTSGFLTGVKKVIPLSVRSGLRTVLFRDAHSLRLDPKDREYLQDYYRADIQRLSTLLDCDLKMWLH
jgi:sulfotransferase family protein